MAFKGWPVEAVEFYDGLEDDNSKAYWQAHKAVYDAAVHAPMVELLAELAPRCGPGRIFRPNRDVRFSADKSPYKTAIGATVDNGGYIQLSAAGLAAGRGMYMMATDQLQRLRHAIDDQSSGAVLVEMVTGVRKAGAEITAHDRLKTAPKGYGKDHPRVDLLCLKGLVAWKQWPVGAWLATVKAKARLVEFFEQTDPLQQWLDSYVGPSTLPSTDRR